MPASPVSSTSWARPATEARNRSTSCRRSAARPTSVAGAATAAGLPAVSRGSSAAYAARVAADGPTPSSRSHTVAHSW